VRELAVLLLHVLTTIVRLAKHGGVRAVVAESVSRPFVERLIGTIRRECLDRTLFWTTADLQMKLVDFQRYYNCHRAHAAVDAHQTRVPNRAAYVRMSVRIAGRYTVAGCIKHQSRRDRWPSAGHASNPEVCPAFAGFPRRSLSDAVRGRGFEGPGTQVIFAVVCSRNWDSPPTRALDDVRPAASWITGANGNSARRLRRSASPRRAPTKVLPNPLHRA